MFKEYDVAELRKSVLPVQVVAAPPTALVNVPPTSRVEPLFKVKLLELAIYISRVVVALPVTVHPPLALASTRL